MKQRACRLSLILVVGFTLIAMPLLAQKSDAASSQAATGDPSVVVKSKTELVMVPVLVRDGHGEHVSGLKQQDFVVKQDGKAQHVTVFEEIKATHTPFIKRAELPPNTYSNVVQEQSPKRLVVIALDTVNTQVLDQTQAREDLIKYLSSEIDPSIMLSLVTVGRGRMRVIHDFTTDPALLVAALRKMRGENNATDLQFEQDQASALQDEVDVLKDFVSMSPQEFMAGAMSRAIAGQRRLVALDTMSAIQQIAQAYAGVPGRKSLIWLTAGFPFMLGDSGLQSVRGVAIDNVLDVMPDYEKTWQVLNDANMSVYPVDVRGLVNYAVLKADTGFMSRNNYRNAGRTQLARQQALHWETLGTMNAFADMTGGKAFYNSNDLPGSFRRAADDSNGYYLLGYYLDKETKPGWHKLKLEVERSGVHVRGRSGFYTTPATTDPEVMHKADIALAMNSPMNFTGLPLTVKWTDVQPIKDVPNKKRVSFVMTVPPNAVEVDDTNSNHVMMEFVGMARTHDGSRAGDFVQKMDGHLKAETLADFRKEGLAYQYTMDLPPGDYSVRFVVRDGISGHIGSVTAPLTVK